MSINYDVIVNTPVEELGVEQKEFLNIHNTILYYGTNVCANLYQMAKQLEVMKDTKAYLNAGFESFESYAEDCLGLKRSQVYNYIKVANTYSNDFLLNNAGRVGITKLLVLSELEEPVVEKVIETIKVEDKTVTDLKELVKSLKAEVKEVKTTKKEEKEKYSSEIKKLKEEITLLKEKKVDLFDHQEETVNNPGDNPELLEKINQLENQLIQKEKELIIKQEELVKLESSSKSNVINNNPELIKFKVIFNDIQKRINDLKVIIDALDEESRTKCINALNHVLRGAIYE